MPSQSQLPVQSRSTELRSQATEPQSNVAGAGARLAGLRVLVVDDDQQMRRLVSRIFARAGATVQTAASAPAAFDSVADFKPHLLVSDLEMPEEDGCSLMRRIRARGSDLGGGTPSIALSGWAADEAREKAISAGFLVHMRKPFVATDLVHAAAALTSNG
jgi:CheY-like chemotaxis protein